MCGISLSDLGISPEFLRATLTFVAESPEGRERILAECLLSSQHHGRDPYHSHQGNVTRSIFLTRKLSLKEGLAARKVKAGVGL